MSAFDKVIGYEKEKEELYQLCDMAKNSAKYAALGVKLPRGILLYGVPGVGKTLMATALLDEMDNGRKRYILRKDKGIEEFVESISKPFRKLKRMRLPLSFSMISISSHLTAIRAIRKNLLPYSPVSMK